MGLENTQPHPSPSDLQVGERGWKLSSVTNGKWFTQSCPHDGTSIKTAKWRTPGSLRIGEQNECTPLLALWIAFAWLFLSCILYNKLATVSKVSSWVLWAIVANYKTWDAGHGNQWFIASWSEVWEAWICSWHLKWRQSGKTEPFTCGGCTNSR